MSVNFSVSEFQEKEIFNKSLTKISFVFIKSLKWQTHLLLRYMLYYSISIQFQFQFGIWISLSGFHYQISPPGGVVINFPNRYRMGKFSTAY